MRGLQAVQRFWATDWRRWEDEGKQVRFFKRTKVYSEANLFHLRYSCCDKSRKWTYALERRRKRVELGVRAGQCPSKSPSRVLHAQSPSSWEVLVDAEISFMQKCQLLNNLVKSLQYLHAGKRVPTSKEATATSLGSPTIPQHRKQALRHHRQGSVLSCGSPNNKAARPL
jgi:hypothetical protein